MSGHAHAHDRADLPPPSVQEVSEGVFAYVQPDGSWWLNNTGFIVGSDAVTAIDMTSTEARNRALLVAMAERTDKPLRTVVNTHWHGDHTHGNYLTLPTATIVGHTRCREAIQQFGVGWPMLDVIFPGVEWGHLEPAPPFLTFDDRVTLWVDDLECQVFHVGPAHTDNDVVVWLPERRVLFTGDVAFNGGQPNNVGGSITGTITALDQLAALAPEVVVPGHGGVCGPEVLAEVHDYMELVLRVAADAAAAGLSSLDAAREADAGRFAEWLDPERLVGNLHCAMAEARGEHADMATAFGDMVTFNGGPLRCFA